MQVQRLRDGCVGLFEKEEWGKEGLESKGGWKARHPEGDRRTRSGRIPRATVRGPDYFIKGNEKPLDTFFFFLNHGSDTI